MSDTNLGPNWAPHRPSCRCDDCLADRTLTELHALRARLAEAERLLRLAEDHIPSDWVYWRDDYHWFVIDAGC